MNSMDAAVLFMITLAANAEPMGVFVKAEMLVRFGRELRI